MPGYEQGEKIVVIVSTLHFVNGGNTIWIEREDGNALRIRCTGKITTEICKTSPSAHCDIEVEGDIHYCVSEDPVKKTGSIKAKKLPR